MEPGAFDFAEPVADVRRVSPVGQPLPPINGTTPRSRHASYTGAVHAAETRSANIVVLRQLWREPRTLNDIHVITGLPLSSVCSLKSAIENELEEVDHEVIDWGPGRKATKRTRWQLKRKGGKNHMADGHEGGVENDKPGDQVQDQADGADAGRAGRRRGRSQAGRGRRLTRYPRGHATGHAAVKNPWAFRNQARGKAPRCP